MPVEDKTIRPRNGHTLVVGIVARISGGQNQKELSLDDQVDHAKHVVADLYDGPVEYRVIATKNKGERLDRPELADVEAMLRSRELDLLVAEDIGRIVRGTAASDLCGVAVDHGTRVIAPNDCIDTAEESWEADVISACRDHVGHNSHTSKRLKQKLMNRFVKFGGAVARPIFGYIVPQVERSDDDDAPTYDEWRKDEAATSVYQEWFRRLLAKPNCSAVADWLNGNNVPTGPYCRGDIWTGKMVRRITENTILKGLPERGRKHTVKYHEFGKRVSVPNPKGPRVRECPHLAFVDPDLFDEVNALLDATNSGCGRKLVNGVDPLHRVPRNRSRFPGRFARCAYCGREYVWGGNGVAANLMCNGSRSWQCWNSIGFNGALAAHMLAEAISDELGRLEGFDVQFRAMVDAAHQGSDQASACRIVELRQRAEHLTRQRSNLMASLREYGPRPDIQSELNAIDEAETALARERRLTERSTSRPLNLPSSVAEVRELFAATLAEFSTNSTEFADRLRPIVSSFHVRLVRLCDGGHLVPQATVELALSGIAPDLLSLPDPSGVLRKQVTLNFFDPPQREKIRLDVVRLESAGFDQRAIAKQLEVTQAVVSKASRLTERMTKLGLTSPYEPVTAQPDDYSKLRRNRNPRYRFDPLPGYPLP
jgi:site-specific DNA recombinase